MKSVLITGAYGGMGKAAVNKLINLGYTVFALDKKVQDLEPNVYPIEADITKIEDIEKAFIKVKSITDELNAIIHFAGIYTLDSLVEISEEEFIKSFNVNVFGAFRVNKVFAPLLKERSKIIITTSELAPLDPLPFTGLYAITKSALDKYAYSLRMELQLKGVFVTVLRCGAVDTGMISTSTAALDKFCQKTKLYSVNAKRFKKIVDKVESRKVSPEKVAKRVCKIINRKKPPFTSNLNRNPLLLLLNLLPQKLQTKIIKLILK